MSAPSPSTPCQETTLTGTNLYASSSLFSFNLLKIQRSSNAIQQIIIAYRLTENAHSTGTQCLETNLFGHESRYDNRWNSNARRSQAFLKLKARHAPQMHVGNETRSCFKLPAGEKVFGRRKPINVETRSI